MRQNRPFPPVPPPSEPVNPAPISRPVRLKHAVGRNFTRFHSVILVILAVVLSVSGMYIYDSRKPAPQRLTQKDIDAAVGRVLETATPKPYYASMAYAGIYQAIVRINATSRASGGKTENSQGTGVVIDDTGLILTSLHVVKDSSKLIVVFYDGMESEAVIMVEQPENDLAVIQPKEIPDDLQPAVLASAAGLRVGDEVTAVGNPFGVNRSLTSGVVSGLGRAFKNPKTGQVLVNLIQFDAAVNPGNSGGPLMNRDGEVVGIVTALLNPTEEDVFIGIAFAVPIESASSAIGSPPF